MSKLLLINPNTNQQATERMLAVARRAAPPSIIIESATVAFGVAAISTPEQSALAEPAVLQVVQEQADSYDGIIIAAFTDPGLQAVRQCFAGVTVGIAESALRMAAEQATRFSIVTLGAELVPLLEKLALDYGVVDNIARIRVLSTPLAQVADAPDAFLDDFRSQCQQAIEQDNIQALVLGGGPVAGLAPALAAQLTLPVLDGVSSAVQRLAGLLTR